MNFTTNLNSLVNDPNVEIDGIKLQKMMILFNAIEDGWSVKKKTRFLCFYKKTRG